MRMRERPFRMTEVCDGCPSVTRRPSRSVYANGHPMTVTGCAFFSEYGPNQPSWLGRVRVPDGCGRQGEHRAYLALREL